MPETASFVAPDFLALTIGIVVFFVGVLITQRVAFLRSYNIPEPVTGGFVAALAFWAVYEVFGLAIDFDMTIERQPDPKGDRVKIGMTGKFLPFKYYGSTGNALAYGLKEI